MIAQSSPRRFSIGVPVSASVRFRGMRRKARWRFVRAFFTSCASSRSSRSHVDAREEVGVAGRDVVGRDDDVVGRRRREEGGAAEPRRPVMDVDAQARREPGDLALPLLRDAHRADDERRADVAAVLPLRDERGDRLHGLAEPHVVGEDPADPEVAQQAEPAVAALLEREEVVAHARRGRQRAEPALSRRGEQLVERLRRAAPHRARCPPRRSPARSRRARARRRRPIGGARR